MKTFRHSGKLGDLVYSLPAVRACGGGAIYLRLGAMGELNEERAKSALPLLRRQSYIAEAAIWKNQPYEVDLDKFREQPRLSHFNLAHAHLSVVEKGACETESPWLHVKSEPHGRPVFARSFDHRNADGFWHDLNGWFADALFVGNEEEHRDFAKSFGGIEWRRTDDLLELAETIAGCSFFVGNQSCPYAIAEGLRVPAILEVDPQSPNCIFERLGVLQLHCW